MSCTDVGVGHSTHCLHLVLLHTHAGSRHHMAEERHRRTEELTLALLGIQLVSCAAAPALLDMLLVLLQCLAVDQYVVQEHDDERNPDEVGTLAASDA